MAVATRKLLALVAIVALVGVLIGVYVVDLTNGPTPYRLPVTVGANGEKTVNLTLQTVAAVGPTLSPNENWVSYLVREHGVWHRSTVWTLPAHTLVRVTVYQFDGDSGLRNPFLARGPRGRRRHVHGGRQGDADDRSRRRLAHVRDSAARADRAAPGRGRRREEPVRLRALLAVERAPHDHLHVPHRQGAATTAGSASCPCAAGFVYGFGGPMQTVGYMDGYVDVV